MILLTALALSTGHDAFNFPWDDSSVASTILTIDPTPFQMATPVIVSFPTFVKKGLNDNDNDNVSDHNSVLDLLPLLPTTLQNDIKSNDNCTSPSGPLRSIISVLNGHTIVNGLSMVCNNDNSGATYPWYTITCNSDRKPKLPTESLPP